MKKETTIPKAKIIDWLIALGLLLVFMLIYWLTISKDPTIDSFATAYWAKSTATHNWFHPHHLLFSYACRFVSMAYQTLFPPLDFLMLLTRCMHILGGLSIGLFYLRLYAMQVPRLKAAAIAILIGTGYGIWLFSTNFELVMPYFVMFLAAWAAAHRWGQSDRKGAFAAGMVLGAGVLVHQSLALYEPAFLILVFMFGERRNRWWRAFSHLAGCLVIITLGYITAFLVLGLEFPTGWYHFFTDYAQSEAFTHGNLADVITSGKDIMSMWLYPIMFADELSLRFLAAMIALLAMVVLAVYRTVKKDPFSAFCLATFAIAFIFFAWWSPTTLDFYVIPAVMIALPTLLLFRWKFIPIIILALATWLFVFNNLPEIKHHAEPQFDCVMETGRRIKAILKPDDKVFWVNQPLDACAAYLEMPAECLLVVENFNEEENMQLFSKYAKSAYDYAVYYDGLFDAMVKNSGMLVKDEELASLMENAKLAVYSKTSSYLLFLWKIQRR